MSGGGAPALLELLRDRGGDELPARLTSLDEARTVGRRKPAPGPRSPDAGAHTDVDVILAGGGLSLLIAPVLAARGLRVAVCDRGRIGAVHREWNASAKELAPLVDSGLLSAEEVQSLVVARYDHGVCRWFGGGSYPVRNVLDHAIDAGALLTLTRQRAEARGVILLDGHEVVGESIGRDGVALTLRHDGKERALTAKVLIDGRGAQSPYATADLICPTVGGVFTGLRQGDADDEMNPRVGDILATTEHVDEGRQHIWEAFPGRPGETTIYLFYYARTETVGPGALAALYERFFARLPIYKKGEAHMVKPTFGYIPGWSRLGPGPRAPGSRCVLLGDAAARHSPLTYCGFGNMLRSFLPVAERLVHALQNGGVGGGADWALPADRTLHAGTGALSMMMSVPKKGEAHAGDLNRLLDSAFATLHELGDELYGQLLRDEMSAPAFVDFLERTAKKRPEVYRDVFSQIGPTRVARWGWSLWRGGGFRRAR